MERTELEVVLEQLDELLAEGVEDPDEAIEVATLAGTAERLGADPHWLEEAVSWRDGAGADLLDDGWDEVDLDALLEAIEAATMGGVDDEAVEEAVFDLDDLAAAAVWCGEEGRIEDASAKAAQMIRELPDVFVELGPYAADLLGRPWVTERPETYAFWFAIAEVTEV